jgi:hypothetical protein
MKLVSLCGRVGIVGFGLLLLGASSLPASGQESNLERDIQKLAARIDNHLVAGWATAQVVPAPLAGDEEFLRRIYVDIAGRIPGVAEARAFLNDKSLDKRRRLVAKLLESPRYVTHFTNFWRAALLPEATSSFQARFLVPGFETWLRKYLVKNAGYDEMVRDLLTATIAPQVFRGRMAASEPNPIAFYLVKELKPENLASGVTRTFLGVRLECAQCHNHPFADWKREQFWNFAAFFAGIKGRTQDDFTTPVAERIDKREIDIPGTGKVVQASFLDGTEPQWKFKVSPRKTLADWMTAADNPYFARAAVNRLWAHFFGNGLIEPVDEMVGTDNVANFPELLDELAKDFAAHRFDLKYLIRAITSTRAYQLTSAGKDKQDPGLFARMPVRGMSPEQLLDSLIQATGFQEPNNPQAFFNPNSLRGEFMTTFAEQGTTPMDAHTSIPQALFLLNGKLVADATSLDKSATLAAVADSPFMNTRQRIETLYLATLSRQPKPPEVERFSAFVEKHKEKERKNALADVFWTLLNSSEFMLNH